jgi:hypothetical protein
MQKGFLAFLGIGKTKDVNFKFSDMLFGSIAKVKALNGADTAGIDREVAEAMSYVTALGDSEAREVLAGAVSDCYKNIEAVAAKKEEVSAKLDELYGRCQAADAEVVRRVLDAGKGDGDKDGEDKKDGDKDKNGADKKDGDKGKDGAGKDARAPDFDALIGAAVDKAFAKVDGHIDAKIDAAMKKALGGGDSASGVKPAVDTRAGDSLEDEDASYLVRGVFGNR